MTEIFDKGRTFYNEPLSRRIRQLVSVEGGEKYGRVYVPYWFPVVQHGRGPRRRTDTTWVMFEGVRMSKFQMAIYFWMEARGMFESQTSRGKIWEAKGLAWYINRYGTRHFRDGRYIDVYDTLIKELVSEMVREVGRESLRVASEIVNIEL